MSNSINAALSPKSSFAQIVQKNASFIQPPRSPCFSPRKAKENRKRPKENFGEENLKWDKQNLVFSKMMNEMNSVFQRNIKQQQEKVNLDQKEVDYESSLLHPSVYSKISRSVDVKMSEKEQKFRAEISDTLARISRKRISSPSAINFLKPPIFDKEKMDYATKKLGNSDAQSYYLNAEQRMYASFEILTSECSYVEQLDTIIRDLVKWMKAFSIVTPSKYLSETQINSYFGTLTDIAKLHHKILIQFIHVFETKCITGFQVEIPNIFVKFVPYFRIYFHYVNSFSSNQRNLSEERKKNADLDLFFSAFEQIHKASVISFLIVPIQRIPRYRLLLERIKNSCMQFTTAEDLVFMKSVDVALQKIDEIAKEIESMMRISEARLKVVELQEKLFKSKVVLVTPTRHCIRVGILGVISNSSKFSSASKQLMFILFNDSLIGCTLPDKGKISEIKYNFSLENTILNLASDMKNEEKSFCFISPDYFVIVVADSQRDKDEWTSDFKSTSSLFQDRKNSIAEREDSSK